MALPPDPEGMNDDRAGWADTAIAAFRKATGTDEADAVSDLIADLRHWCDRKELPWEAELARGLEHYRIETSPEGGA